MPGCDIIVIGASAGGVEATIRLAAQLPSALPAAVFVVVHFPPHSTSVLPRALDRAGSLPAAHAQDGEAIEPGRIYVAPPNSHLLLEQGRVRLGQGAKENGHRPAVDPLFRSAALAYGNRVAGVILTGTLDDGVAGLQAIKARGGTAVVQSPDDALYPGMPRNALTYVNVDYVVPLAEMGALLARLTNGPPPALDAPPASAQLHRETAFAAFDLAAIETEQRPGSPSVFGCPACGGVLWEMQAGALTHYRCRVGHAYAPTALLTAQDSALEAALWAALRVLEERAALLRRLIERATRSSHELVAARFQEQLAETKGQALLLQQLLLHDQESFDTGQPPHDQNAGA